MKKCFYFALALTAGLFASCSSDDIAQAPEANVVESDGGAPIKISVANPGVTRGTGSVGSVGTDLTTQNKWMGQTFNIYMFKKGTFIPAQYKTLDANGDEVMKDIYNNAVLKTDETGTTSAATYYLDLEAQNPEQGYVYYPTSGSYSFFAYRLDDASAVTANNPITGVATSADDDNAQEVLVPFKVDGSQDIMFGVPDVDRAVAALNGTGPVPAVPATTAADYAEKKAAYDAWVAEQDYSKIYSAASSRKEVHPYIKFSHALTRLTFQVKAASKDVSTEADMTGAPTGYRAGFQVTEVFVYAPATGKLVAAYKSDNAPAQRLQWEDFDWSAPKNYTQAQIEAASDNKMMLRSRQNKVDEKAEIAFVEVDPEVPTGTVRNAANGYEFYNGLQAPATSITLPATEEALAAYVVYKSNEIDAETGLPTSTATTTIGALKAANTAAGKIYGQDGYQKGWIITRKTEKGTKHATENKTMDICLYTQENEVNKNLTATLIPVIPGWNGTEASNGSDEVLATATANTTANTENTYNNPGQNQTAVPQDNTNLDTEAKCLADVRKKTANGTYIYKVGENNPTYYAWDVTSPYVAAVPATQAVANTEKTNVGEALLVAPADENGYEVFVTFNRTKKVSATKVDPITETTHFTVKRNIVNAGGVKQAVPFLAGSSYNIVFTLNSDGEIKPSDTEIIPLNEGDGLEEEYEANPS